MITGVLIAILAASVVGLGVLLFLLFRSKPAGSAKNATDKATKRKAASDQAVEDVEHVFNEEFREELRNHGRLYFDKIIGENAMFLQQDLRLTSSQLNDYMKKEISTKLEEAFGAYEQTLKDAQEAAMEAIQKTLRANEEQQIALTKQTEELLAAEKQRAVQHFEDNMADIVNHYLAEAFGNQLSLEDQLGYIVGEMEANKEAMKQDMHA
jgi:hypothetical protein